MSHPGMRSRWYRTLNAGVPELSDEDVRFRVQRWEIPAGASLDHVAEATPTLWAVDAGEVVAMSAEDAADSEATPPRSFKADSAVCG